MRRLALTFALLGALAAPAGVLAAQSADGDGTLVVQNAEAPNGVAAVKLKITGSVIGQVQGIGKIIIDAGPDGPTPDVRGAGTPRPVPTDPDGSSQQWGPTDSFRFRAVGGTFTIVIYGSDIDLVAIGSGKVKLTGMPDITQRDGRYSLNGDDWTSMPVDSSDWIPIGSSA